MTAAADVAAPATGELSLFVTRQGSRSVVSDESHDGLLRTLRPLYLDDTGQVTAIVVNPGGGYLGGDSYRQHITVAADAWALVTTQSATRVYRTPRAPARQHTDVRLGPGAALEWVPDQLIAYAGARYLQSCRVELDSTASFVAADVITPGWAADGSRFAYESIVSRTEVVVDGRLEALDNLRLEPRSGAVGALEGHTHVGSLLVVDRRVDDTLVDAVAIVVAAHARASSVRWGVSRLGCPGLLLRMLGAGTAALQEVTLDVIADLRARWGGGGRPTLRKY